MTNEEHSIISILLRDFEARFNSRIECLPKYYDRTKSIDNRLQQVEKHVQILASHKSQETTLSIVLSACLGIAIADTLAILYLLFS